MCGFARVVAALLKFFFFFFLSFCACLSVLHFGVSFEAEEEEEEEEERRRRRINNKKRSSGWVGNQFLNLLFFFCFGFFFPPRSSPIDSNRSLSVVVLEFSRNKSLSILLLSGYKDHCILEGWFSQSQQLVFQRRVFFFGSSNCRNFSFEITD